MSNSGSELATDHPNLAISTISDMNEKIIKTAKNQ